MCELFALSASLPVTAVFSLERFSRHGGLEGPHKDGWGVAHYEDGDVRLLKEPDCAAQSPWLRFIEAHPLRGDTLLAHIRKATRGGRTLANTQPFARELGGHMHVFAHNGDLPGIESANGFRLGRFRPVGVTDSEWAFCALLERLSEPWLDAAAPPPLDQRLAAVEAFAADLRKLGPANFLYCDGDVLFAHGHRRRQGPAGVLAPPGLVVLQRHCRPETAIPPVISGLDLGEQDQEVTLLASVPLTDEPWRPLGEGDIIVARAGRIIVDCQDAMTGAR